MSFILRVVIVLIVFSFVVYVLKAIARLSFNVRKTVKDVRQLRDEMGHGNSRGARAKVNAEMVRCTACGAFVAAGEAMKLSSGGRTQSFCSKDCIQAHARN